MSYNKLIKTEKDYNDNDKWSGRFSAFEYIRRHIVFPERCLF